MSTLSGGQTDRLGVNQAGRLAFRKAEIRAGEKTGWREGRQARRRYERWSASKSGRR